MSGSLALVTTCFKIFFSSLFKRGNLKLGYEVGFSTAFVGLVIFLDSGAGSYFSDLNCLSLLAGLASLLDYLGWNFSYDFSMAYKRIWVKLSAPQLHLYEIYT